MHSLLLILLLTMQSLIGHPESNRWGTVEIAEANTGKNVTYLNEVEKETLLYLNLARLYPRKYAQIEVPRDMLFSRSEKAKWLLYRKSLLKTLNSMHPLQALQPDSLMTVNAKCFAKESSELGTVGHKRIQCTKENWEECCAYGSATGRQIVLSLLIDYNVPSLGHRYACLSEINTKAGLGFDNHPRYRYCLVLVMQ